MTYKELAKKVKSKGVRQKVIDVKNFIKETDKILLLLCTLASAYGCVSVLSA